MNIMPFDADRDREACHRIWSECGWADLSKENEVRGMDLVFDSARGWVVHQDGEAECAVFCSRGDIQYLGEPLPFSGVMAVTTSRIGRKQGYAMRLTAHGVAEDAAEGALVSGLGIFEQGYYNRIGFGNGDYSVYARFDPQALNVPACKRPPVRLTEADFEEVHAARLRRMKSHGAVSFDSPSITRQGMLAEPNGFGLGFRDPDSGQLTHFFWAGTKDVEDGPYGVHFYAYETWNQFTELMGLIKNLGDQVRQIELKEPSGIQLSDLIDQPIHQHYSTSGTKRAMGVQALSISQFRMNDVPACLDRTHLRCEEFRFNLRLTDPIEEFLDADARWKGAGGDFIVTLGKSCAAEKGHDSAFPTLEATVNAFSRLWLAVRPASGLAVTDSLSAPGELLDQLDWAFQLPSPKRGWPF